MKLLSLNLLVVSASAFAPTSGSKAATELHAGLFDNLFQPIHGRESGEKDLGSTKTQLKKKDFSKNKGRDKWIASFFSDFEPIHGHGTAEKNLDEIKQAQEQVLHERKKSYGNKNMLKKKYSNPKLDHHGEIPVISQNPADLNKKEDDSMYVAEDNIHVPSFHIEEAADSLMDKLNSWVDKQAPGGKNLSP